jgi:NAD(P)-dependent dehydrogenase (short-subunit alcohol dehydrogenase family)
VAGEWDGAGVLVTGAASGIGRATALAFVAAGARVTAADVDADGLTTVARTGAEAVVADVRVPEQVAVMVAAAASATGRLDVAVNNAGVAGSYRPLWEYTEADVADLLSVDLLGVWRCLKFESRQMIAQGGAAGIVNVSSMLAKVGMADNALYCAAKHGVHGLTRAAALELAPHGVRVNAVAPGVTRTRLTNAVSDKLLADVPLGRIAEPEEIADAVLWLARGSYATGSVVTVDGGFTAR